MVSRSRSRVTLKSQVIIALETVILKLAVQSWVERDSTQCSSKLVLHRNVFNSHRESLTVMTVVVVVNAVLGHRLHVVASRTECRRATAAVQRTTSLGCWSWSCWCSSSARLQLSLLSCLSSCSAKTPRLVRVRSSSTSVSATCSSSSTRRWTSSFTASAATRFEKLSSPSSVAALSQYHPASRPSEPRSLAHLSPATVAAACWQVPDSWQSHRETMEPYRQLAPHTSRCSGCSSRW